MQWSDVSFRPSQRVLRQFAALVLVVFGGAAAWFAAHDEPWRAIVVGIIAAVIGSLGRGAPGGPAGLYGLDAGGLSDRLDRIADPAGLDLLRAVHADRADVPIAGA